MFGCVPLCVMLNLASHYLVSISLLESVGPCLTHYLADDY